MEKQIEAMFKDDEPDRVEVEMYSDSDGEWDDDEDGEEASSTDSSDMDEPDSDLEDPKFMIHDLGTIAVYGKSKCGKTSFILDLISGGHFDPVPDKIYVVLGSTGELQLSKADPYISLMKSLGRNPVDSLLIGTSIPEVRAEMMKDKESGKVEKQLIIMDDLCTVSVPEEVSHFINETVHHCSIYLAITVQEIFVKDGAALRRGADYQVVFPGPTAGQLSKFLQLDDKSVAGHIKGLLSARSQNYQDGYADDIVAIGTPIIIDKSKPNGQLEIWAGLHSRSPFIAIQEGGKNTAMTSNEFIDYLEQR